MPQRLLALPLVLLLLAGCGSVATTSGALQPAPTATPVASAAPSAGTAPSASSRPSAVVGGAPSPRPTVGGAAGVPPGLAATATAVAALPLPSSLPNASAAPSGPPAKIGEKVTVNGEAVTLVSVQDNAPAGALPPAAGERRYIIDLIVENVGTDPVLYSALFGTIILADGNTVGVTFDTEPTPQFAGGAVNPAESARGWLTFDLPQGATPDQFVYDNLNGVVTYALR